MAIVRKDKLLAGYNGNLESVIVHDSADKTLEITNGVFVTLGALLAGQRETRKANLTKVGDHTKDVFLIHNSEVMYDERLYKLADFRIRAGKVARAYRLYDGDIFTLTTDLFNGTVKVGDKLIVGANGKLGKDDTKVAEAKVVFEVIEDAGFELDMNMGAFAVQVVRN
ncbi:capsid stabilizing protein [Bacillus phage vB_BanS-Thrax3]|nr:capsid stabilizing protein [Bacillus phage vB_BanS-Thrax3]